jgi:2-methylisocitrate lyase-like PEP mutase family enzyme
MVCEKGERALKYSTLLRKLLGDEQTLLVPGCYDAFSAKILKQVGFEVIYMTGSGVTASRDGEPG